MSSQTNMPATSMRAVTYTYIGGQGEISLTTHPMPLPAAGEVLVRAGLVGVNAADLTLLETGFNFFTGQSCLESPTPTVPGGEVVGVREDNGQRVVALCWSKGYAEWVAVPESRVFPIPDHISDTDALALATSGLTAWFALHACPVGPEDSVVVTGAAGALGSILVQLAVSRGAGKVIALASTPHKRALTTGYGAHVAIDSSPENLGNRILEANDNAPVDLVFDMAGGRVFAESRAALKKFGTLAVYGASEPDPPPFVPAHLALGSHTVKGVWLPDSVDTGLAREALQELFEAVRRGQVRMPEGPSFALDQVREAHAALADRTTVGKVQIAMA